MGRIPLSISISSQSRTQLCAFILFHTICNDKFFVGYKALLVVVASDFEPFRFSKTTPHFPWREAMQSEIHTLKRNHTRGLTFLPLVTRLWTINRFIRLSVNPIETLRFINSFDNSWQYPY